MTVAASAFDYMGKKRAAASGSAIGKIDDLEKRLAALESQAAEREERIKALEGEVSFVNRLLERKTE